MTIKPRCPYFGACGGCQLQHLPYEEQLMLKTDVVRHELEKQWLREVEIRPALGMAEPWFYRNKIQFPVREQNNHLQMGYFKERSHEVVNIKECYIQDPCLTEIAQIARDIFEDKELSAYDEKSGRGLLRHFVARSGFETGEILLGIVINGKGLPAGYAVAAGIKKQERLMHRQVARRREYPRFSRRIIGIVQNVNTARSNAILGRQNTTLFGSPTLREKLGKIRFEIQLNSFFQVNPTQAVRLYDCVKEFAALSGKESVVDAYAGIGAIALWLADRVGEMIVIEESASAVKDAVRNVKLNNLANVKIEQGRTEKVFPKRADVVVLDPPRGGCSEKALELVRRAAPKRIVYVSCNPETMARDLRILSGAGFKLEMIQPVDMFPQTSHIEAVARLSRRG